MWHPEKSPPEKLAEQLNQQVGILKGRLFLPKWMNCGIRNADSASAEYCSPFTCVSVCVCTGVTSHFFTFITCIRPNIF